MERPSSLITRPSSPLITRPSSLIVRPSSLIVRPSSLITRRSSLIITRSSFRIACRSSSSKPKTNYDVFLSFRGETRNNFTSHLYEALCQKGIHTFLDDDELVRGKVISTELPKAIEGSRCSVVILSGDYASSRWCLDELVKILQCMKDLRQIVLPIFYHVDPSHVRKQIGSFGEAFQSHEQVFSHDLGKVKSWRAALAEVGNLAGYHLQDDGNEAQFIQDFIKEVSSKLDGPLLNISKDLVGMDSRLEELKLCVSKSRFEDVGFIGICGMGGLGKTTLARAYFKYMSCQFEATSFLANVREVCEKDYNGLVKLQQQLLSDILRGEHKISNVYEGIGMITERLCDKKVLVILDDVDQLNQIEVLAEKNNWFGPGSRIILTTRDESLLTSSYEEEEYVIHKVDILEYREALKLFSWKAFKKDRPLEDYIKLSKTVVEYANGLPLALEVLGSYLRGKSVNQWKSALDRLKEYPKREIMKVLQISFDGLEETEKSIFLDIACFFNGSREDYIMRIMDSCGFFPEIGIRSLVDKSLLHMDHDDKLRMHDLLEEMGKEIVREKSRNEPGRRSRIWLRNDFYHVMNNNTGTEEVEAIACDYIGPARSFSLRGFSNMKKLRLLILSSPIIDRQKDEYYLSDELRFLEWNGFPFGFFGPNFQPHGLVELILYDSLIKRFWNNPMEPLYNLKSIDLSWSTVRKLEDFSLYPNLEKLILDGCEYLEEIDPSITVLKRLTLLSLECCRELKSLPTSMDGLESLKVLKLRHCGRLGNLPEDLGCLNNLEELDVRDSGIRVVPSSIRNLKALTSLDFRGCENLTSMGSELPNSLEIITASNCRKLHTFLDPLSQWDLPCSAIFCVNCFSMVNRQGSKRTAITSLGRYLQNPTSASKRFDIVLPGAEIPSWFTCQIWASSSINLPLLPNWCNNKWMGFALSVSFRNFEVPHVMYWQIKINQQDWGFGHVYCLADISIADNPHVWLLYLPRDTYFRTEWQNKFGQIQFSLKCRYAEETFIKKFKIGGVRLVYEQDIQELNRTARDEPIESMKLLSRNICDKDEDGVIPIDDNK